MGLQVILACKVLITYVARIGIFPSMNPRMPIVRCAGWTYGKAGLAGELLAPRMGSFVLSQEIAAGC